MKKSLLLFGLLMLIMVSVFSINQPTVVAADDQVMKVNDNLGLLHPRRSACMTLIGDKIYVTGGRAYDSHFNQWGKGKYVKYAGYANMEIIDLKTQKVTYTNLATGGQDFYKSTAFQTSVGSPIIYMAASNALAKLDTEKMTWTKIANFGENGDRSKGSWGDMTIKGKLYTVLVTEDKMISYFDAATEKFVKIPGVKSEVPNLGMSGAIINNKFYVFGDDTGTKKCYVFDPNLPEAEQIKPIADMPYPANTITVVTLNNKIYILGGNADGDFSAAVLEYDPATDKYTRRTDLPRTGTNLGFCVKGDTIYLSWGYSWGTLEEGNLGFRVHPSLTVEYKPAMDTGVQSFGAKHSVSGKLMNITLGWPDANKITGPDQAVAITWMANTASSGGNLYYRVKGTEKFEVAAAKKTAYAVASTEAFSYRALISVKPKTRYEYYVVSEGKQPIKSALYSFDSQPAKAPKKFQVFAYGDSKSEYHVSNEVNGFLWQNIQDSKAAGNNPAFIIQMGDFGSIGAVMEYEAWFNYGRTKSYTQSMLAQFPFLAVHGNHEELQPSFFNTFAFPSNGLSGWPAIKPNGERYYSYNYGKAHFIVLTTGTYLGQAWYDKDQLEFLKQDLAYAKKMKEAGKINWVLVVWHTNVLTTGEHFKDLNLQGLHDPGFYLDVIEQSGIVDVTLGAHDHDYERSKAVLGYRWTKEGGNISYYKTAKAYADPNSGQYGTVKQGKGIIHFVIGTAGAAQRDLFDAKKVGDLSWLAFRKPDPGRGEKVKSSPVFGYAVLTISDNELSVDVIEQSVKPLLSEVSDDAFTGILDGITITR